LSGKPSPGYSKSINKDRFMPRQLSAQEFNFKFHDGVWLSWVLGVWLKHLRDLYFGFIEVRAKIFVAGIIYISCLGIA
jgi:hypothetical protein